MTTELDDCAVLTLAEVARLAGLSAHALRYYEKAGLVESVGRNPGALTTLGEQQQLQAHLRFALNIGVPREELVEVLIQMAVYAGWPRAINALYTARDLVDSLDQQPDDNSAG